MDNKTIRIANLQVYGNICMCGYKISRDNPLTMHHILPKSLGGKTTMENGSNVTYLPHSGIHILSDDNIKKAKEIRDYLFYFKEHPDITASEQFKEWLHNELVNIDCVIVHDKLLHYGRRR